MKTVVELIAYALEWEMDNTQQANKLRKEFKLSSTGVHVFNFTCV